MSAASLQTPGFSPASSTCLIDLVFPGDTNHHGTLFGGAGFALMDRIAGRDWNPLDRSIDVLIAKLRKKIEPDPARPTLIKAVRGEGYKFTAPVSID